MFQLSPGTEAERGRKRARVVSGRQSCPLSAGRSHFSARRSSESRRPSEVPAMSARGCKPSRLLLPALLLLLLWLPRLAVDAAGAAGARWNGEGTSPNLQSIFLGRCNDYRPLLSPEEQNKNCTAIWEAFKLVLDKDPCSVLPSDYDLFISLSRHSLPRDKSLFWENNHLLVTSYADNTRRFTPLCDVLYGRVGDFLSWCRQENASGLDYQSCPTAEDCENNPVDSYWKRASIQYSKDSSGVIHVMLNGSEPTGAYPIKGFFADFEIPYFQKDKITRIEIWVMHEIGGPNVESCGEGSVKVLEERLEEMGFQYSCINDYVPVKLLKCVDHSTHPDCALNSAAASTRREVPALYAEQSAGLIVLLLVALASVAGE
ncbi:ADP-ribosyl cyclase/cyclic ADP-ribose hydrolase 2 isoform X2 [Equus przewalskii]|uniref:ADP-ribosyl cyclase/cyclic ADP-ribose hydrolase n=2 Tax=Equus TaxID=9789 RepID=A0A9L0RL74_HORSE|nr:PREDICTED: ADP-ribosyl cyclase/cyclic ADP-ribose hydrolase 2 isoform X2 [Equus przewalskii]XP_023494108.1 ADP-ribosyl cyclase/cyclic ADP-ribose hydrolase 2 isoform X2 [Equus caballus]